ncbi:uncharacterized protein LOC132943370 isoform X2 [Metopolophium dirhodum]|uniref:uncharacterized protein LOC132943370 isoform X2 n=1 Tax=Metopolophium dirhodum TaxID=44670 RepID=UPI00298FE151|nr:uncharacterized protein LOC132943370 isoform X2 [Metopolophium dirhodum]
MLNPHYLKDNPRQLGHICLLYFAYVSLPFIIINAYTLGDIPFKWVKFRSAYLYQPKHPYYDDNDVCIGVMDVICQYCNAMKFKGESAGMCCSNGTVRIPNIDKPPEPMKTLLENSTNISKHFLENINKYNNAFHMTSFGAAETIVENYMPTFKIRGQVYHLARSLMPLPNTNHKYLQVYFMDDEEEQIDARMGVCSGLNKDIIRDLQLLLHNVNPLITKFKTALDHMPTDQYRIVINANMVPRGQHRGRFNAPSQVEMAVIMIGEEYGNRDIILSRKDEKLQRISETHRSYDSLEYPLIFLHGEDGYAIDILSFNVNLNEYNSHKTVS